MLAKLNLVKFAVLAIVLCALVTGLRLPRLQGQNDVAGVAPPSAPSTGVTSSKLNPFQIALLHWENTNQTTSFGVGATPGWAAFDGANLWVTNSGSNSLTELRGADGLTEGTFAVGTNPMGVACDGTNIWVANEVDGTVTKLLASSGATLAAFPAGTSPYGIAFDGTNIWVTNLFANSVTKLLASNGSTLGTFTVGSEPAGVAFDGSNIWVVNFVGSTVTKLMVGVV
jgi:hypothetical protein